MSIQQRSAEILERLDPQLRTWVEDRDLRVELKFSRLFSSGTVIAITEEIARRDSNPAKKVRSGHSKRLRVEAASC
jgi:hypothetical protein